VLIATSAPQNGKTPLQNALEKGHQMVAKMLREAGARE